MKHLKIKQYRDGTFQDLQDVVAEETIAHIEINNKVSFDTIISPVSYAKDDNDIKHFVYGNLFTEGFIKQAMACTQCISQCCPSFVVFGPPQQSCLMHSYWIILS